MDDNLSTTPQLGASSSSNASNDANSAIPAAVVTEDLSSGNRPPAKNSSEPINLDLQPKPSRAVIVWMLLIAVVLAVLGYEMHGEKRTAYNVVISMNGDVKNYEIVVDGEPRGKFKVNDKNDDDLHTAWLKIDDGKHHVDIKKDGQPIQSRDFEVKGKAYLRFDSGSTSESN
ncbi:MAG: hypothetical protein SGJ27_29690 [Candidatus Melainabacteria bacterium]|mgnify:CR=1 FL=1|nr:hypothetical protein [Candidatus Melainabacteria bacterium]